MLFFMPPAPMIHQARLLTRTSLTHYKNVRTAPATAHRKWRLSALASFTCGSAALCYDWRKNELNYSKSIIRFVRSISTATLIAIDYLWLENQHRHAENYDELLKLVHAKSANRLLETCLSNGGLYIKVGQGVAAINHILPLEYTSTLAALQDRCLPTSGDDVRKVFLEEFQLAPDDLFESFSYTPVAAASLAQVFKAKLKTGEEVAVKVQYRDLQKRFTSDLGTIIFIQNIIEFFFKNYNFGWILHDVYNNLISELNFINEGQNSERCARDLSKLKFVYIPKVHWPYTKQRILTMEWIDGIKISDLQAIGKHKLSIKDIDEKLFKIFAEQIFQSGFVHADPHPGNIMVRNRTGRNGAELILLDHGLYEEVPKNLRIQLCQFWEATVLQNEKKMQRIAEQLHITDYKKFAEILFQQPLQLQNVRIKTKLTEEDIQHMQEIAKNHFDAIMDTLKEMPKNMLFVVRNLNTIRAIGREHGDVVNRPRLMARCAQQSAYINRRSVRSYLLWIYKRILFEWKIWCANMQISLLELHIKTLSLLGRAPKATVGILHSLY